jgi:hypothetical protein
MKARANLGDLTTAQLVERFTQITLQQGVCVKGNDVARFNKLFAQMVQVTDELRSRPGDARRALIPLYSHSDRQVRLKAAIHTLAINRDAARRVLEELAKDKFYQQAADAGIALIEMDRGLYKPT